MIISWYGYRCVRLEAKEGTVLIDPAGKEVGIRGPRIKDDLVLVTSSAPGAADIDRDEGEGFLISGPGEYERHGVAVWGVPAFADAVNGIERGRTTIYRIAAEDLTLCHLGGIGQHELTDEQVEEIGDVDILFVPVGGNGTLDAKAAASVVSQIEPKIIIPIQYKIEGAGYDADGVEKFVKEIGMTPEKVDKFRVAKKTLPVEEMKLVLIEA